MTEKHYLRSGGYNEGRKLRVILRNIKEGNLKIIAVRMRGGDDKTVLETEGTLDKGLY